ncbi:MAG: galactose mutarotase [Deltaproteobacteria bacterium]|nr:galactose mutarotase [Deltaproteobacteria bacterium]
MRGRPLVEVEPFGTTRGGEAVQRFTLTNRAGTRACWLSYGATLSELWVPDRTGERADVVLGFDTLREYEAERRWFGCIVGRVANRIADGRFELDGVEYELECNDGTNHLHGGSHGLAEKVWHGHQVARSEGPALCFEVESHDGDGGYPGHLRAEVTYVLGEDDALAIEYRATTDAPTLVNLTNHAYFDLEGAGTTLGHELSLDAASYTEPGPGLIPTGRILPVEGTPLDFRAGKPIGRDLPAVAGGYDHNFVLSDANEARPAAVAHGPVTGRVMEVSTTAPGLQFYSGNFLDGILGKRGARYGRHAGFCLEAQGFPDAIHHSGFPSVVLRPGETYEQRTVYRFAAPSGFATLSSRRSA